MNNQTFDKTKWQISVLCTQFTLNMKETPQSSNHNRDEPSCASSSAFQLTSETAPTFLTLSESVCTRYRKCILDKPLLLVFINGLCEIELGGDDGGVGRFRTFGLFGLVGVVRSLVPEHVAYQEHQNAQDSEDDHSNDA